MDHSEENRMSSSNESKRKRAYERPIVVRHAPLSRITSVSIASILHHLAPPPGPPPAPSDIRLKEDITLLRHLPSGIGLYRYRYKSGTQTRPMRRTLRSLRRRCLLPPVFYQA